MSFALPGNTAFVAAVATIALAGSWLSPSLARPIAALTAAGFLAGVAFNTHSVGSALVSPGVGLLFTYIASDALRRLREEQRRTQELLQEVIAGRDASIRAAALDERSRLAREMHDILAHTLSALTIQLESARLLVEQRPGDPSTVVAVERASKLAREGLEEARRAVGSLRGDTLPGPELLCKLAADFEQDTGIPVHLEVEGTARDLPADGRLALYRVAQEALTNVRKHADASSVAMTLRYSDIGAGLTVENEGKERLSPVIGGGFGLSGMRERAELLGGRLEAGPTGHGFRVHLWIPAQLRG
jgi:signal transduction histidine kinase